MASIPPLPQAPWNLSADVVARLQPAHPRFKTTVLQPTDSEFQFVHRQFHNDKPPGLNIASVTCVYNRTLLMGFLAQLSHIEEEAKKFHPNWGNEPQAAERKKVIEEWKELTEPFSPLKLTIDQDEEILTHAKVLPLWHGTSLEKARSICESGFTYFGKHAFFSGDHGAGSTDIGFFGSGIYFTDSARYSAMYSSGYMLLSWISMREPYPVVSDQPHPTKCADMHVLEGKGAFRNFDSHFIPVASIAPNNPRCMLYYPCFQNQPPAWNEFVVFQKAQAYPSFIIELGLEVVRSLSVNYTFDDCFAACKAGDALQVKSWIGANKKRLLEENAQGENFLFAATLGQQLPLLKWLHTQDPSLLKKTRKDGWSLMHVAASQGDVKTVSWLNRQDAQMIHSGKPTPLHFAAFGEHIEVLRYFLTIVQQDPTLAEEVLKRPCPATLKFLLDNGLDFNQPNRFKQTLLHLAAQYGQVQHIELLIEKGALIDVQDLSKKTPLYLAVAQGHHAATLCLIDKGADPSIKGIEGDTILHVAAFYGYTPLLKALFTYPQVKTLLKSQDDDGKQPIHKAVWGEAKPDIVKILLEKGSDPNAINKFNYTPLHWAAKHGHIESAELLIKANASLEIANQNHDLPFDLAIRFGQDPFIHFFLGMEPKQVEQSPKDIEAYYCTQLLQSKREENYKEQIFYLVKLSDLYVQKNNWVQAAKILNGAFAILEKNSHPTFLKNYLFARLERIEALFLESQKIKVPYQHKGTVLNYRTWLNNIRTDYFKECEQGKPIQGILPFLTNSYRKLLGTLILDSVELLGVPPTGWSCVGMGSMARNEMCPYSDLEFAFLIKEKSDKNLKYFRMLAQLLEIRIINTGETKFPIFAPIFGQLSKKASPTPAGFCMDSGGNTPLGKPGFYELIDTPQGLAQFQSLEWMDADIIVTNALSTVCHIAGDEKLVKAYHEAKEKALNATDGYFSFTGVPFRKKLATKLLQGNLDEFKPNLSKEKQEISAFGIKKELYRPLQSMLSMMSLLCGLEVSSTVTMIQRLVKKKILSAQGAANLNKALDQILSLRFKAHMFYRNEEELLLHPEKGTPQDPHFLYLNESQLKTLHDIYMVLIPLQRCGEAFLKTDDINVFGKALFYDESPIVQGEAFSKTLQYGEAQKAYQSAVSLNPNDVNALCELGIVETEIAQPKEALPRLLRALKLARERYGENHFKVALSCHSIGIIYGNSYEFDQALLYFHQALNILLALSNSHSNVATCYNSIGSVHQSRGEFDQALKFYQLALEIGLKLCGEHALVVASSHNLIGGIHFAREQRDQALESFNLALKIELPILGENHPSVAQIYGSIGKVYLAHRDFDQALAFYEKALSTLISVFGKDHPSVAGIYSDMGGVYSTQENFNKALELHQSALAIRSAVLGKNHPDVSTSFNLMGVVYQQLGELDLALECHLNALQIWLMTSNENHPKAAEIYATIGMLHYNKKDYNQALEFQQKALKTWIQLFGENHSSVGVSCSMIGLIYIELLDFEQALMFHTKALTCFLNVHDKSNHHIEEALKCVIACAEMAGGDRSWLKGVSVQCTQFLGDHHPLAQELAQFLAPLQRPGFRIPRRGKQMDPILMETLFK